MGSICSKESKLEVLVVPFSLIPVFLAPSPPPPSWLLARTYAHKPVVGMVA